MSVDLSTRLWDPLRSLLYYFVRTQLYLSFFYLVSSSHKLCGQLKVKLLLSVLVFTWYVLIVHWRYLDDDGFQDFQAYSLGGILMEHFPKVLIIVLFVCLFCMFVGFSSIYGASHCRYTSNAGGFCVHVVSQLVV